MLRMSWEQGPYAVKIMATATMRVTCMNIMSTTGKSYTLRFSLILFRNWSLLSVGEESALMP